MTDVAGDMDAVYKRAEKKFSSIEAQAEWLKSFGGKHGGSSYEKGAVEVGDELESAIELRDKSKDAGDITTLNDYASEAKKLKYGKDIALDPINKKIKEFEKEEVEIQEISTEIREEISDVSRETLTKQRARESEIDEEIQGLQEAADAGEISQSTVDSEERTKKEDLRRELQRDNEAILKKKQKFETILRETEDPRKRKNAKRNLKKLSSRL